MILFASQTQFLSINCNLQKKAQISNSDLFQEFSIVLNKEYFALKNIESKGTDILRNSKVICYEHIFFFI